MKLLLDEDMPLRAAAMLRESQREAHHVLEVGLGGRSNADLLKVAMTNSAVICTSDSDLHRLLALGGHTKPSVTRIRREPIDARSAAALLIDGLAAVGPQLQEGAVVSVAHEIRLRRLPLIDPAA